MAIAKGHNFVVQIADKSGSPYAVGSPISYTTIARMRTTSASFSSDTPTIEPTKTDPSGWSSKLDGVGQKSLTISLAGQIDSTDNAVAQRIYDNFDEQALDYFRLVSVPYNFTGQFQITSLEISGDWNTESGISITLESSGDVTKVNN